MIPNKDFENTVQDFTQRPVKKRSEFFKQSLPAKNITGILGERCKTCSGLGYVVNITGSAGDCTRCEGTGIEPVNTHQLKKEVDEIKKTLGEILKAVKK